MTGISITLYFHLLLTCFQLHYNTPLLLLLYPPTAFHLSLSLCHTSCSHSGSPVTPAVSLHMTHCRSLPSSLLCSSSSSSFFSSASIFLCSSSSSSSNSAPPSCLQRESGAYVKSWRLKAGLNSHLEKLWVFVCTCTLCLWEKVTNRQTQRWTLEELKKRKPNLIHTDLIWSLITWLETEESNQLLFLSFTVPLFTYVSWSNDALTCVCSTLILIQFGWSRSFRQLSAARATDGFLASYAGMRE